MKLPSMLAFVMLSLVFAAVNALLRFLLINSENRKAF